MSSNITNKRNAPEGSGVVSPGKKVKREDNSAESSSEITSSSYGTVNILGDIFTDIVAKVPAKIAVGGDTLSKIDVFPGGSGLNISVHLASYLSSQSQSSSQPKLQAAMYSCVGNDVHGEMCIKALKDAGVDESHVIVCKDTKIKTGTCIVLSSGTERSFITDGGCNETELSLSLFSPKQQNDLFSSNMKHFHCSGLYNLPNLRQVDEKSGLQNNLRNLFLNAKNRSSNSNSRSSSPSLSPLKRKFVDMPVITSMNPQYDANGKWDSVRGVCDLLDIFIGNEEEVMQISNSNEARRKYTSNDSTTNSNTYEVDFFPKTKSLTEAAMRILSWGAGIVVSTLGKRGAVAFFRTETNVLTQGGSISPGSPRRKATQTQAQTQSALIIPTYDSMSPMKKKKSEFDNSVYYLRELECVGKRLDAPIVDTTGAGDAFAGAFLGALHISCMKSNANANVETTFQNVTAIPDLWFSEEDIAYAMKVGCEAGGRACTVLGGSTLAR